MTRFGALQLSSDGTQTIIVGLLPENGCLLGGGVEAQLVAEHDPARSGDHPAGRCAQQLRDTL
jgi:hypothetical protein